jgi:hypothetical protein
MSPTIEQINDRNRGFWKVLSKLTAERMSDETLCKVAVADMSSEIVRGIPLKQQKSIEKALEDAEKARAIFQSGFSRKGGKTPTCDTLQTLIEQIAREKPKINARQLALALKGDRGVGTVTSIDHEAYVKAGEPRMILFVNDDASQELRHFLV